MTEGPMVILVTIVFSLAAIVLLAIAIAWFADHEKRLCNLEKTRNRYD